MKRSKNPQPKNILNLAASTTSGARAVWGNRHAPGTIAYKHEPNQVRSTGNDVLFVEHGSCPLHPLSRALLWCVSIAVIVPALTAAPFIFENGVDRDGVLLTLFLMVLCGSVTGACILWIAWVTRTITLWPVALFHCKSGILVQLIYRRPWCMIDTLSPALAVGTVEWIEGKYGKPIHPRKLHNDVLPRMHACWLRLSYESRCRWVLLSIHEDQNLADIAAMDWASKLQLNTDEAFTDEIPPQKLIYYWNPKLFGTKE